VRARCQRGQTSAEYLGALLLLVAIVFVLVVGLTPFLLIPIVVIAIFSFGATPKDKLTFGLNDGFTLEGPSGVPTTGEASYNPVQDPGERPTTG